MKPYSATPVQVIAPLFSERLISSMRSSDFTVRDLAKQSKVNKDTINKWRQGGDKPVTVKLVRRVASKLGTTAEYLLDLPHVSTTGKPPPAPPLEPVIGRVEELVGELSMAVAEVRRVGATK